MEKVVVRVIGDDAATVHGLWQLDGQARPPDKASAPSDNHSPPGRRRGILLIVAERRPDGWYAVTAQNTDIIPGAETITAEGSKRVPRSYRSPRDF